MAAKTTLAERRLEAVSKKIRILAEAAGLSVAELGRRCGVKPSTMQDIAIRKKHLPGPELAARIVAVLLENKDFSKHPRIAYLQKQRAKKYRVLRTHIPRRLYSQMNTRAKQHGLSITTFVMLAIQRLVDNEPAMVSFGMAMERYEEAEQTRLFAENVSLVEILEGEAEVAARVAEKTAVQEVTEPKSPWPTDPILAAEMYDGAATPLWDPDSLTMEEV